MKFRKMMIPISGILLLVGIILIHKNFGVQASFLEQQATTLMATVTGTPIGAVVKVKTDAGEPQINVRSGPGPFFPAIGVLLIGQEAPAKGISPGRDWILIVYPGVPGGTGWVYAPLVNLTPGIELPIVVPPPTPTPQYTMTIDPTLAAQFVVTVQPSRLPTFTPPPPLAIPTYSVPSGANGTGGIPMGLVIIVLLAIGFFVAVVSFIRNR